jgi:hypothetical protein
MVRSSARAGAVVLCVLGLSAVNCKRATTPTPTPTTASDGAVDAGRSAPLDAAVVRTVESVVSDAGAADASVRPLRWTATREWRLPAPAVDADSGAEDGASADASVVVASATLRQRAQLVRSGDGVVAISTFYDPDERRNPIVARRFDSAGRATGRTVVLGHYTGEFIDIAASVNGEHLWVLWRADSFEESGATSVKTLGVHARSDLSRAAAAVMVRQRNKGRDEFVAPITAVHARADGGAWVRLGGAMRPARDLDPIYRISEDDRVDYYRLESLSIDPSHNVEPLSYMDELWREENCSRPADALALFVANDEATFVASALACRLVSGHAVRAVDKPSFAWSNAGPFIARDGHGSFGVIEGRLTVASVRADGAMVLAEHAYELRNSDGDGGTLRAGQARSVTYDLARVLCEGGELFLASSATTTSRERLTGPRSDVDLATFIGPLLGLRYDDLRPRTLQWTGTHLLYLPDAGALFAPSLRRWRCDNGALVGD